MMEGLPVEDLMKEVAGPQKIESKLQLSERNIVDLITKLKDLDYLGRDELLHTLDGKEFVTREQLIKDLELALQSNGGRVPILDLPSLLNCDLVHCETAAAVLMSRSHGSVFETQGEIMTSAYINTAADEIQELLVALGQINLADLALRFSLGAEFILRRVIEPNIGSRIQGTLENASLYTPAFLLNLKARLRGALRASTTPILIQSMHRSIGAIGLPEGLHPQSDGSNTLLPSLASSTFGSSAGSHPVVSLSTFNGVVAELAEEGAIRGSIKGGIWTPALYDEIQSRNLYDYYQANGWVPHSLLKK
mmetsp:Transcript_26681/g.49005  ORF Transcript_26681/g.49005 Transcript_26681/m.49005 type:complete len:307 (-) Transcript_26681:180-1100(-)